MKTSDSVACKDLPCTDVEKNAYIIPCVEVDADKVKMVMISEAAPRSAADYYYAEGDPLFQRTTVQAFKDAGVKADSIKDLLAMGFYFTTAVKCGKTGYSVGGATVKACSQILKHELSLFPNVKVVMLMGNVVIKAFNEVARRQTGKPVIPSGSTYKIRGGEFNFKGIRVFPSYLQAGPAFFIEKSKRTMIADDIRRALAALAF